MRHAVDLVASNKIHVNRLLSQPERHAWTEMNCFENSFFTKLLFL